MSTLAWVLATWRKRIFPALYGESVFMNAMLRVRPGFGAMLIGWPPSTVALHFVMRYGGVPIPCLSKASATECAMYVELSTEPSNMMPISGADLMLASFRPLIIGTGPGPLIAFQS